MLKKIIEKLNELKEILNIKKINKEAKIGLEKLGYLKGDFDVDLDINNRRMVLMEIYVKECILDHVLDYHQSEIKGKLKKNNKKHKLSEYRGGKIIKSGRPAEKPKPHTPQKTKKGK